MARTKRKKKLSRIPTPKQQEASARNGANSPGRPRVAINWKRVDDLFWEGDKAIAAALGISVRTLQRRRATRHAASKPDALGE